MSHKQIAVIAFGVVSLLALLGMFLEIRQALKPVELSELELRRDIAELTLKTATIQDADAIRQHPMLKKIRVFMAGVWQIAPLILLFAGFAALTLYPVPFESFGVKTRLARWQVAPVTQTALRVQAASEMAKVAMLREEVESSRVGEITKLAQALRPSGRTGGTMLSSAAADMPALAPPVENISFDRAVSDMSPGHILIGYANSNPVRFRVSDFVSCAFGGGSGSGKTSKLRVFIAQLALQGVNLHILDAHTGDEQSLVNTLGNVVNLPNVTVHSPMDTKDTIDFYLADVEQAIRTPQQKTPTVYVIDELLPILDVAPKTEKFMQKVATEGRKFERYGLFSSQVWPASLFAKSGSSTRDALMLKMAARMSKDQARILFKNNDTAQAVDKLSRPEMFAHSMTFSGVVTVPYATTTDMNNLVSRGAWAA